MRRIRAIDVVWFNYPTYVAAALVVVGSAFVVLAVPLPVLRVSIGLGAAIAAWWVSASIVTATWVFDRDEYGSLGWITEVLRGRQASWLNVTAGFDATTIALRNELDPAPGSALDLFDPSGHHDGPVLRARRSRPPQETSALPGAPLPVDAGSTGVVTMLMSAHELDGDLSEVLRELARVLRPDGTLVLAEFTRSPINLLLFGPGALHCHTRQDWLRLLHSAGFHVSTESRITPFVHVFVASPSTS